MDVCGKLTYTLPLVFHIFFFVDLWLHVISRGPSSNFCPDIPMLLIRVSNMGMQLCPFFYSHV